MSTDLMPVFFGFCLRATVVLGLAWVLTMVMRRASASARHFVWTSAIAAAALVPLTAFVLPDWRVPAPSALAGLSSRLAPAIAPAPQTGAPEAETAQPSAPEPRGVTAAAPSTTRSATLSAAGIVMIIWAVGTTAVLLYLMIGFAGAWWMRRRAVGANARLVEEADTLAEALEVRGRVAAALRTELSATIRE